jgi:hypothetical protein
MNEKEQLAKIAMVLNSKNKLNSSILNFFSLSSDAFFGLFDCDCTHANNLNINCVNS